MPKNAKSNTNVDEVKAKMGDQSSSSPLDKTSAASATNTVRYKTRGTITSIDLIGRSFKIDPISPYVFEQKKGENSEKFMIFVTSENKEKNIRDAWILKCNPYFKVPTDIDLCAIIALKNGREKIELEVESKDSLNDGSFDAENDKLQIASLKTA